MLLLLLRTSQASPHSVAETHSRAALNECAMMRRLRTFNLTDPARVARPLPFLVFRANSRRLPRACPLVPIQFDWDD